MILEGMELREVGEVGEVGKQKQGTKVGVCRALRGLPLLIRVDGNVGQGTR
jgi:hypothetical protein